MVWTINYLTIISINKLEPASSEGDHLLCKIFVFIRPGFETRCRPSLFQAQILIHKKCLTPRLWKMSEILQPPKKLDEFGKTVIERECCQIKLFLYDVGDVIHKFKCVFSSQYIYYLQCDALLSKFMFSFFCLMIQLIESGFKVDLGMWIILAHLKISSKGLIAGLDPFVKFQHFDSIFYPTNWLTWPVPSYIVISYKVLGSIWSKYRRSSQNIKMF